MPSTLSQCSCNRKAGNQTISVKPAGDAVPNATEQIVDGAEHQGEAFGRHGRTATCAVDEDTRQEPGRRKTGMFQDTSKTIINKKFMLHDYHQAACSGHYRMTGFTYTSY